MDFFAYKFTFIPATHTTPLQILVREDHLSPGEVPVIKKNWFRDAVVLIFHTWWKTFVIVRLKREPALSTGVVPLSLLTLQLLIIRVGTSHRRSYTKLASCGPTFDFKTCFDWVYLGYFLCAYAKHLHPRVSDAETEQYIYGSQMTN